jgi:hypothetical protein
MSPTKNLILIKLSESEKTSFGKEDFAHQSLPQKVLPPSLDFNPVPQLWRLVAAFRLV